MKRFIDKKMIFSFILGAVMFGTIGTIAASLTANEISFTPKDTSFVKENGEIVENVEEALDLIYKKATKLSGFNNNFLYSDFQYKHDRTNDNETKLELSKGKYFCIYIHNTAGGVEGLQSKLFSST